MGIYLRIFNSHICNMLGEALDNMAVDNPLSFNLDKVKHK